MEMIPVQVEADVSDGMPQFTMVGYVSAQVKGGAGPRADSPQKHGNFPAAETNYD